MDTSAYIEDSKVSDTASVYKLARIVKSQLDTLTEVADFARVYDSRLKDCVKVGRNSFVLGSDLGNYTYLGHNSTIMHSSVGKFTSISWNVTIGPANHDYTKLTTHDLLYNKSYGIFDEEVMPMYDRFEKKTHVGHDVWIGAGAVILNGVHVSNGAIVGANAVVTKDVPPYAIVVGSPAKVIKYRFSDDIVKELEDIKWWDQPITTIKKLQSLISESVSMAQIDKIKEVIK
jgi:acetyltransferase-like isoleucine patch superfamily enzyme